MMNLDLDLKAVQESLEKVYEAAGVTIENIKDSWSPVELIKLKEHEAKAKENIKNGVITQIIK